MASKDNLYPIDDELRTFINGRKRRGTIWQSLFLLSLFVAMLVLVVLLLNIINEAFGYVAVENEIEPSSLVRTHFESEMIALPNTTASEDDGDLVDGVADDPNAVGYFGYAFYENNADDLKLISVDGVVPSAETVTSGEYPLARPLYIYTSVETLQENPAVASYINFYLQNVNEVIGEVGYFAEADSIVDAQLAQIAEFTGDVGTPEEVVGEIQVAGSSTVYPLSRQLLINFRKAGFSDTVGIESTGTSAGIRAFCDGDIQVLNASRPMTLGESINCANNGHQPVEIPVGIDAIAVVANPDNAFLTDISSAELQQIFTEKTAWNEVNSAYPAENIVRFIPGMDSGTLDFFTDNLFAGVTLADMPDEALVAVIGENLGRGRGRALERDQRFLADGFLFDNQEAFDAACAEAEPALACSAPVRDRANLLEVIDAEIVVPQVEETWTLYDSVFNRN
ncbi:MAG: substrate-binding domain-containing protein, partial [Chloroflexota bacterium]